VDVQDTNHALKFSTVADVLTVLISLAALVVVAYSALVVARRNANAADTSAIEAGRAADASNRSADASEASAGHAASSAQSARQVARIEADRQHETYRPIMANGKAFQESRNPRTKELDRFFQFSLPRTFRVEGDALIGRSRTPLSISPLVEAGSVKVFVDTRNHPTVERLHLRFWPMADGDPGEHWTCPCGRPLDSGGPPHWEWYVEVPERRVVTIY
jgi:hypothetical protein